MCIIVAKPAGTALPDMDTLRTCFANNDDGAGYMLARDGRVEVRKGLMTWQACRASLAALGDVTALPMVLHFRIGTQGKLDADNTHPFPVTTDPKLLVARKSVCTVALAHNGIIQLTTTRTTYQADTREPHSDTYYFTRDYVTDIVTDTDFHNDPHRIALLRKLSSQSKLALLGADGHLTLIGEYTEEDGCYYSNSGYKWQTIATYTPHTYAPLATYDGIDAWEQIPMRSLARVPDGLWVMNDATGECIPADSDEHLYDRHGVAYVLDEYTHGAIELLGYAVVDDDFHTVHAPIEDTRRLYEIVDQWDSEHDEPLDRPADDISSRTAPARWADEDRSSKP